MKIYLIPGLAADKRMYHHQLSLFADAEVLEHLPPVAGESLRDYAERLAPSIDQSSPFVLIGTSLGGMISVELSRLVKAEKVILIASVKSRNELPLFMRSMKYLRLHKFLSGNAVKRFNNLAARRLDGRGDDEAAELVSEMIMDASPEFIEWAIDAVINWSPPALRAEEVIHIHGTNDRLFSFGRIKNALPVEGGSHVMNITLSREVNRLLLETINEVK